MRKKIFTFLLALAASVGMSWADVIPCTAADLGKVLCTDGSIYATVSEASAASKTAAAVIAYVDTENAKALALALADDGGEMEWATAKTTAAAHTPAVSGGTWTLASKDDWDNMINAAGGYEALRDGFSGVGGTNMNEDKYWSSTPENAYAWCYYFDYGMWVDGYVDNPCRVRACLAFDIPAEPQLAVANTLQLHVNDAAMGSVALQDPSNDIFDFGDGTYAVPEGATVTLIATPNEGYEFIGWKASSSICDFNDCEFTALPTVANPLTFDMNNEVAFMAEFAAVAPTPSNPEIKLNGNFSGEWADTEAFEVVEQPMDSYAKLTKLLEPGTYEFGVKVNGELRANGSAYTRENYSYIIEEGYTGNLTINVDVKGYYSFYWYYDNNRLTIDYSRVCGMYWKNVTAGNFEVTLGQEGEVTLPKVWATSMAFVANIANGADQVRLGSTDETVATIAYTLSLDGLGTLTFHQAGECDIYVVHDITNLYCYDSCAFHLTVHPAPTTAVEIGDQSNADQVTDFLNTYNGQTIDELIIDRPVLNNMYNTLCLPFDMNATQIAASSLNGVEIREFTGASVEGTTLNLSVGDPVNAVVAGRPYFVKYSAASQLDDLHFEDITINNALLDNMAVTFDGVTFKGTFTPFVMPNGLNFQGGYLFLGQNNQLFWPNTSNPLKPFRAYFYVDVESSTPGNAPKYRGMPARIEEGKNVATGVENAQSANQSTKVIVNGQLIIIKNDVRYNAQGQIVK